MYLRPEAYAQAEEYLKVLLADLITAVQNGMDPEEARKLAYERIYYIYSLQLMDGGRGFSDITYVISSIEHTVFM